MHMMRKTGMFCLRVSNPHFIFDFIFVLTIQTHMRHLLIEDLALALNQLFSICPISILHPLNIGGGI